MQLEQYKLFFDPLLEHKRVAQRNLLLKYDRIPNLVVEKLVSRGRVEFQNEIYQPCQTYFEQILIYDCLHLDLTKTNEIKNETPVYCKYL